MSRLFLSHSSQDNFVAKAMADWLADEGWTDVFLDILPERGIAAGQRWERALHQAADRCEAVVFLITRAWLSSGWCGKEYELAHSLGKQLFAVIAERGLTLADLPPELTGAWQVTDLAGGADHRLFAARLPGGEEERHVLFSKAGLDRLKAGLKKAGLEAHEFPWPPEGAQNPAPYVGLRALLAEEAGLFFGRDADLVRTLDRLRSLAEAAAPRLAVILGASGAGKSSFLRAGLLPRLARDDARFLPLPAIRPGRAALEGEGGLIAALDAAVEAPHARADIRAAVARGAAGVRDWLRPLVAAAQARAMAAKPPTVVIAVDQAEELFSADDGGLTDLLAELARDDDPAVLLMFAIRSDAYDALQHAKPLEGMAQEALQLPPLPRHAARAVIEGPATRYAQNVGKLDLDPRLTQGLLDDLDRGGGRDALPLLAFTLEHLWREYGRSGALTLAGYEAFGGLAGAIEAGVQRAYARADQDRRIPHDAAARDALLRRGLVPWLAGIDPDTKAPRRNVARAADIPEEARPLIDLMVEERLLSRGADESGVATIEPAHEALLRQWGKLRGWLEEDFALLAALEAVQRASRDWDANARGEAWLAHRGQRLAEAAGLDLRPDLAAKFSAQDREYLAACRAFEEAARAEAERARADREAAQAQALADARAIAAANRRVARRTGVGLAAALVLALAAGGAAVFAKRQADYAAEQKAVADQEANRARTQEAIAKERADFAKLQEQRASERAEEAQRQQAIAKRETDNAKAQQEEAERQKSAALTQADRADHAVANAVKAVSTIVFDVSDKLRYRAGVPVEVLQALIDPVMALGQKLVDSGETSKQLRREYAVALGEAEETYQSAGDLPAATKAVERAIILFRTLAEETNTVGAYRDLSVTLNRLGSVKFQGNDTSGALAAYQEGLSIRRNIAAADPHDEDARRDVSDSLTDLGDAKIQMGDEKGALDAYNEGLEIDRKVATDKPNDVEAQKYLATDLNRVGNVKLSADDQTGALAAYKEMFDIDSKVAANNPTDADAQRNLSVGFNKLGNVYILSGDHAGALAALAAYEKSLEIARKLAKTDSKNAQAQRDMLVSLNGVGNAKLIAGDPTGAVAAYQEMLNIARQLAQSDPDSAQAQRDVSVGLQKLANGLLKIGKSANALLAYRESLDIRRKLVALDPHNVEAKADLVDSLVGLAKAGDAVTRHLREALTILDSLQADGQLSPNLKSLSADIENALKSAPTK